MKRSIFFWKKSQNAWFKQAQVQNILQKVRWNLPDFNPKIFAHNPPKIKAPIFVEFAKNITPSYAKSLFLAGLICPFELVVFYDKQTDVMHLKKILKTARFLNKNLLSKNTKAQIFSLNINLPVQVFSRQKESCILINNQKPSSCRFENNICYCQTDNAVLCRTFFGGQFIFVDNKNNNKINFEIKKILFFNDFNYFLLKKEKNYFIYDLNHNQKVFLLCSKPHKVSLKKTVCGKGVVLTVVVQSNESFGLYFGKENIAIYQKDLKEKIFLLANNQFSSKINSKNQKLNFFFNKYLPSLVLKEQIFDKVCKVNIKQFLKNLPTKISQSQNAEKAYWLIKTCFVKHSKNAVIFNRVGFENFCFQTNFLGQTKIINFVKSPVQKIVVGGVEYVNCCAVSRRIFEKYNQFDVYG